MGYLAYAAQHDAIFKEVSTKKVNKLLFELNLLQVGSFSIVFQKL